MLTYVTNTHVTNVTMLLSEESMSCFQLTEELASTNSLHETTTGKNNFKVQKTTLKYNLECNQFKCVTTHSGKYICGAEINKDRQT